MRPKFLSIPLIAVLFFGSSFFLQSVGALGLRPQTLVLSDGEVGKVEIVVENVPAGVNGVSVQLELSNLVVTDLNEANNVLSIGICEGGAKFTSSEVCVDLAATSPFTEGQAIATLTVVKSGSADAVVKVKDGTKYADGSPLPQIDLLKVLDRGSNNLLGGGQNSGGATQIANNPLLLMAAALISGLIVVVIMWYLIKYKVAKGAKAAASVDSVAQPEMPPLNNY